MLLSFSYFRFFFAILYIDYPLRQTVTLTLVVNVIPEGDAAGAGRLLFQSEPSLDTVEDPSSHEDVASFTLVGDVARTYRPNARVRAGHRVGEAIQSSHASRHSKGRFLLVPRPYVQASIAPSSDTHPAAESLDPDATIREGKALHPDDAVCAATAPFRVGVADGDL